MNVGVAHSEQNPNTSWLNSKGIWFTYIIFTFTMHLILLSLPFLTTATAWTLTNVLHNVVSLPESLPSFLILLYFDPGLTFECLLCLGILLFAAYRERFALGELGPRKGQVLYVLGTN
jgi:hypothetical protein